MIGAEFGSACVESPAGRKIRWRRRCGPGHADRLEVHQALRDLVPNLYLFGVQEGPVPDWVEHTPTWPDVEIAVGATLSS